MPLKQRESTLNSQEWQKLLSNQKTAVNKKH